MGVALGLALSELRSLMEPRRKLTQKIAHLQQPPEATLWTTRDFQCAAHASGPDIGRLSVS